MADLPQSDACFVKAYPAETTEAFCDGHNAAFAFFGGAPRTMLYDNTRLAVGRILGDGKRERTRAFTELQSHYLFTERFGRPGKGNDKGNVEGMVGFTRRNFFVPIPHVDSFDALNRHLEVCCRERLSRRVRGGSETIGERLERDRAALLPLPATPFDACEKWGTSVSSQSLVRYRTNDYSVPVRYGHHNVVVRGYVDRVVISCGTEVIATHVRSYEHEDVVYDPFHYLALLEKKTGALDQAAPLARWELARGVRSAAQEVGDPAGQVWQARVRTEPGAMTKSSTDTAGSFVATPPVRSSRSAIPAPMASLSPRSSGGRGSESSSIS